MVRRGKGKGGRSIGRWNWVDKRWKGEGGRMRGREERARWIKGIMVRENRRSGGGGWREKREAARGEKTNWYR